MKLIHRQYLNESFESIDTIIKENISKEDALFYIEEYLHSKKNYVPAPIIPWESEDGNIYYYYGSYSSNFTLLK